MTSSVGAPTIAMIDEGILVSAVSTEHKTIVPTLKGGYIVTNSVFFLHCDVRKRHHPIQAFRQELEQLQVRTELASAAVNQWNHVWMLRFHSLATKFRVLASSKLQVKGALTRV